MTGQIVPFNPLDKRNLAASVAEALLSRPSIPLQHVAVFQGAGIYALYYTGAFPSYREVSARNQKGRFSAPIYVGKAVPAGARKGLATESASTTRALANRLMEHADSIKAASTTLRIEDFFCRFLVADEIWIPLGESLLIARYAPVWNTLIDGFGNHDPGRGRYDGMRPRWDVLHPGRSWASRCKHRPESVKDIQRDVTNFLRTARFPSDVRLIQADEGQPDPDRRGSHS